jgi:hypothetical protein
MPGTIKIHEDKVKIMVLETYVTTATSSILPAPWLIGFIATNLTQKQKSKRVAIVTSSIDSLSRPEDSTIRLC